MMSAMISFETVKALNLPIGEYVIFGSGPLKAHGIRESRDIDLLVTGELYSDLSAKGWDKQSTTDGEEFLVNQNVEVYKRWSFGSYNPGTEEIIGRAEIIDDLPFATLQDVIIWKSALGREKDVEDLRLIDDYIKSKDD